MLYVEENNFIIRPYDPQDLSFFLEMYNDKEVMTFIPGGLKEWNAHEVEEKMVKCNTQPGIGIHTVETKEHEFMGEAGIFNYPETDTYEIGFILRRNFWNQGYGTKVCKTLLSYCRTNLHAKRVYARLYKQNSGSAKVCIKSGMKLVQEDILPDGSVRLTFSLDL